MRHPSSSLLVASVVLHLVGCYVSAVNVSLPIDAPPDSEPLSPTLVSFSLEQDRWPEWTGVEARNNFTYNALMNYATLTGQPPDIRVGANSEDHTTWSPTVTLNDDDYPPPDDITPYPEATQITVGNDYYQLSRYLPRGTRMVWGVNLGANNATNAVNMANAVLSSFQSSAVKAAGIVLDRIEVGNEPDLYTHNGLRPKNWTVNDYVREWTASAGPVVQALGISGRNGSIALQGFAFANQGFTPRKVYNLSILDSAPGRAISVVSQHHYQAHFCKGGNFSLVSFMNKTAVRSNLSIFDEDIAATRAKGLGYVLGETNSVACHGAPGVSNSAGSALWAIDYTLRAAARGIRQAFFHQGIGYKYNFIQPVSLNRSVIDGSTLDPPSPPQLMPSYYGGLVINSLIGSSGSAKVVELSVDDSNVSGYAAFEQGKLVRAVFVNLHAWLQSSTGARPSIHVNLNINGTSSGLSAFSSRSVVARRLILQHADDISNLTWAGQSFETSDALPKGAVVDERVSWDTGLNLRSSEAVLVDFQETTPVSATSTGSSRSNTGKYIAAGVVSGVAVAILGAAGVYYARRRVASKRKLSPSTSVVTVTGTPEEKF
ncbi:glycoside hydrolase family 79 protein [Lentinus brumalis]|uniref:Glycoside hydrolase family 79 protein n=1 Tax=Lentinus brumalis TaxID=2498619 RepID=A0A371D7K4_9APHY|nr:glycoside hydrolase family 79 protein [Polyporus brumalis]